jgi:Uma2 family endonuclease
MEDEVRYYYDSHATEKDRMGQPSNHADLVRYLWNVLDWLFQGQTCAIYKNLNFYQTSDPFEYPEEPDLALIKGIAYQKFTKSYRVGKSGPAPHVIFEVASDETWKIDLEEKPMRYAHMGVQEYFAYDPYEPPLPESGNRRLFGWQLDQDRRIMREMSVGLDGSLWSPLLESRLMPDGYYLRLYDEHNQMRLTGAEEMARQTEELRRKADALRRIQIYSEKLRSLGINPDQII